MTDKTTLTLCSYNIRFVLDRWDERQSLLESTLAATKADVIGLQEVNIGTRLGQHKRLQEVMSDAAHAPFSTFPSPGARLYFQALPYVGAFFNAEQNPLARFSYDAYAWFNEHFISSIMGPYAQLIYHHEVLRVLLYGILGTGWVFGTSLLAADSMRPQEDDVLLVGGWRAAQCVQVKPSSTSDDQVLVVNVHLSSAPEQEDIRVEEMTSIFAWVDAKRAADPTIKTVAILGDFNAKPHGDCYKFIVDHGYKSAHVAAHAAEPKITFHQGLESPTKDVDDESTLDYVFVRGDKVVVEGVDLIGTTHAEDDSTLYPSDHFGLVARLAFD